MVVPSRILSDPKRATQINYHVFASIAGVTLNESKADRMTVVYCSEKDMPLLSGLLEMNSS